MRTGLLLAGGREEDLGAGRPVFLQPKLSANQNAEALFDLGMARNGCLLAVSGIGVDIVFLAVASQDTARAHEFPDEILAFHATSTTISFVWTLGCRGEVPSSSINMP